MPGRNGAEVADITRGSHPGLPIIFASGYADIVAIEAVTGSSSTMLRKPFDIDELDGAVRKMLKSARKVRANS
jgi:DNA-binding NtrC family response regulator